VILRLVERHGVEIHRPHRLVGCDQHDVDEARVRAETFAEPDEERRRHRRGDVDRDSRQNLVGFDVGSDDVMSREGDDGIGRTRRRRHKGHAAVRIGEPPGRGVGEEPSEGVRSGW
jgi:hypothetical protein